MLTQVWLVLDLRLPFVPKPLLLWIAHLNCHLAAACSAPRSAPASPGLDWPPQTDPEHSLPPKPHPCRYLATVRAASPQYQVWPVLDWPSPTDPEHSLPPNVRSCR